jgi:hypothetical protein
MGIKIESSTPAGPIWETSGIAPQNTAAKVGLPFSKDTLQVAQDAKKAWGFISPEIAASMVGTGVDSSKSHHRLEPPQFNTAKLTAVNEEIGVLIPKIEDKESSSESSQSTDINDTLLLLLYIACMKSQQSNREEGTKLSLNNIQMRQETNKMLMGEYFKANDEKLSRSQTNEVLSWVSWGLWGALAVAGAASIALTIATGGAAAPTVLVVANAALALGSGSVTITQGVLNYQNDKSTGEMKGIEAERYVNSQKIREEIDQMKQSAQVIAESWEALIEVLSNQYYASTNK